MTSLQRSHTLFGYKAIEFSKSFTGKIGRRLVGPFLIWTLGFVSLGVVGIFYVLGLFAVIQSRIAR
jgi:hypothetical protein